MAQNTLNDLETRLFTKTFFLNRSGVRDIGNEVILRIPAQSWQNATQTMKDHLLDIFILNENLQEVVDTEKARINGNRRKGGRSSSIR